MFAASRKPGGYGSYGRGTAGVGSDLDLLLILQRFDEPIWERLRRWKTPALSLACDLLAYGLPRWRSLRQWNPRLAEVVGQERRWLGAISDALQVQLTPVGSLHLAAQPAPSSTRAISSASQRSKAESSALSPGQSSRAPSSRCRTCSGSRSSAYRSSA